MVLENKAMRRSPDPMRSGHNKKMTREVHNNVLFTRYYSITFISHYGGGGK
jgi:hypothetical protein